MKRTAILFALSLLLLIVASCGSRNSELIDTKVVNNPVSAQTGGSASPQPTFAFDRTEHDFGKLVDGEKVAFSFRFVNSGNADLVISQAKGSCGCTVPKFPTNPIRPGEEGFIEVSFDSSNRPGFQNKTITVIANTMPATVVLTIKANVVKL